MFYAFFLCFCSINLSVLAKSLTLDIQGESAILMNAKTGAILYEKNSRESQFPASITKVATALYALVSKADQLDTLIPAEGEAIASVSEAAIRRSNFTLPSHYIEQGSSHIGIKKGETLTLSDLIYGMMLVSGNDASNVIAQYVSGSIPKFVEELNDYVKSIGCENTHFCNPHGLHHPKHVTTAYDMALIAKEGLKQPFFRKVVKTVTFTRPKTNMQEATTLVQFNKLLRAGKYHYDKAIGIKTGHTSFALNTFVAAASDDDRTLILVLLKTKERSDIFTDAIKVFEEAFNETKMEKTLIRAGKQEFVLQLENAGKPLETYATNDFTLQFYPSEEPKIRSFLRWDGLKLPIHKGQRVGEVVILNETLRTKESVPLYAEDDVHVSSSWFPW